MFATCLTIKNFWFCLELEPTVIAFHPFYMIIKYSWISFYLSFGSIAHVLHPHYISMKCTRCSAGCRLCRKESVINYHSPLFNYWITGPLKKTKKKNLLDKSGAERVVWIFRAKESRKTRQKNPMVLSSCRSCRTEPRVSLRMGRWAWDSRGERSVGQWGHCTSKKQPALSGNKTHTHRVNR